MQRHVELSAQLAQTPSQLSHEDRLILAGKIGMVVAILLRPETLVERSPALELPPAPEPKPPAPRGISSAI